MKTAALIIILVGFVIELWFWRRLNKKIDGLEEKADAPRHRFEQLDV